jgi:hypothetical protein
LFLCLTTQSSLIVIFSQSYHEQSSITIDFFQYLCISYTHVTCFINIFL